MKNTKYLLLLPLLLLLNCGGKVQPQQRASTAAPTLPASAVFLGDSLTFGFDLNAYFPTRTYINRGVPGQAAWAINDRFMTDVVAVHPVAVVILAGTNDISFHPISDVVTYLQKMTEEGKAAGIRVVLCTLPPMRGALVANNPTIVELNADIRALAAAEGVTVADYYRVLADADGQLNATAAANDIHLNAHGYDLIAPVATAALLRPDGQ